MDIISKMAGVSDWLEVKTATVDRSELVLCTVGATVVSYGLLEVLCNFTDYQSDAKKKIMKFVRSLPPIRKMIDEGLNKLKKECLEDAKSGFEACGPKVCELPETGWDIEKIEKSVLEGVSSGKYDWRSGKLSGGVFSGSDKGYTEFMAEMFRRTLWTNPLHADIFPGTRKMEAEIIAITKELMHCGPDAIGCVTTGGSESLVLAMKAYCTYARKVRGISTPEIVACRLIHPAVDKAAHYLGAKVRKIDINYNTCQLDINQMRRAINRNTAVLVGTSVDFTYGVIDDIEGIAALGERYNVPVHVDACMGGFILAFMDRAEYPVPPFDFRVKGVTSMSADTHKFAQCPKGTSVLLYSDREYLHHQYFSVPDWPGGIYATPTVSGSRAGVNIAMCWAALMHKGVDSFVSDTKAIICNARRYKQEIRKIPGLKVMGDPLGPIVTFVSDKYNCYSIADLLADRGWHMISVHSPPGVSFCMTSLQSDPKIIDNIIADIKDILKQMDKDPEMLTTGIGGKVYGTVTKINDTGIIAEAAKLYQDIYYYTPEDDFA